MIFKDIKARARHLHKTLIIGAVSLSLLGVLSGCRQITMNTNLSNINLTKTLVNHNIRSKSLDKMLLSQYKWPIPGPVPDSDYVSYEAAFSDTILHNGYVEQSDAKNSTRYFSGFGKNLDEIKPSNSKSKADTQTVTYHIDNKKHTLTFSSTHVNNILQSITYKLIGSSNSSYIFKPIRLHRFGHKHSTKVPKSTARHNILKLRLGKHVYKKYNH